MFVGGIRALLLQSLHPLAMAGVAGHSGYRGDPWGRLQRTSYFLAVTTFGLASDAQAATRRVRAIHERVTGTAPDGRPYAAPDPRLLTWVHIAEADSFLCAHSRSGASRWIRQGATGMLPTWRGCCRARGSRPASHRGRARRPDQAVPDRAAGHRRSSRGGPVPAAQPAAAGSRPSTLRRARRCSDVTAARMGPPPASPALPAAHRDRSGPPGRPRNRPGNPLGYHLAARGAGQLTPLPGWPGRTYGQAGRMVRSRMVMSSSRRLARMSPVYSAAISVRT